MLILQFLKHDVIRSDCVRPIGLRHLEFQARTPYISLKKIVLMCVAVSSDEIETWWKKYSTFQGSYSPGMIADLMEVAGKNISNNREKLLEQIGAAVGLKKSRR